MDFILNRKKVCGCISLLLMGLMMIFIAELVLIKIVLMIIILLLVPKHFFISQSVLIVYGSMILFGLWGILIGLLNQTPYPFYAISTNFMWPTFAVLVLLPQLRSDEAFMTLIRCMFYIHAFLVVYDIVYAYSIIIGFPFINLYSNIESGVEFTFYGTSSRMNFMNLNTLTFTSPLFLMIWLTKYSININRTFQTIVLILNLFLLILSGRRSLMLVFVAAPFAIMMFRVFIPKNNFQSVKRYLVILTISFVAILLYLYSTEPMIVDGYVETFVKAFDAEREPIKFAQSKMLIEEFEKSPIYGHGLGAEFFEPFPGRQQRGHVFELTYQFKLAQTGIIGVILYLIAIIGPLVMGLWLAKKKKDSLFIFILFSYFFVVLADATNPVLASFDTMIPLFLCYAKMNIYSYK